MARKPSILWFWALVPYTLPHTIALPQTHVYFHPHAPTYTTAPTCNNLVSYVQAHCGRVRRVLQMVGVSNPPKRAVDWSSNDTSALY